MKADIHSIDRNHFMVHQHKVGEHDCFLVQPVPFGTVWTKENLIYRSSLWDIEGNPVSLSFKKFFNLGEKPDLFPAPSSLKYARLMEKLDGSTLIFSKYKGNLVVRTRGTVDVRVQPNGNEVDFLLNKYPKFKAFLDSVQNSESYIFEWMTPSNRIVLDYGDEPDMALIAVIYHDSYDMMSQTSLDELAKMMNLRRPNTYSYDNIDDMKKAVSDMRDKEGICLYYNNEQDILKIKSAHYLMLHRLKSEVSNIENVIDAYLSYKDVLCDHYPSYDEFFDYLTNTYDYEIAVMAKNHITKIVNGINRVFEIMTDMARFAKELDGLSRKEQAAIILKTHGESGRAPYIFAILDNKPFDKDKIKKLLLQVLENEYKGIKE